ncbi:radical SAM family heme chaperone HemW [Beggiatoa leptomitoformis]|uniref:Heme chaperone HemW n=1 Tax=Beggiatoa leptomitoformis TaxID=288004 RepID=A0A2N9YGC1_9GAMM|nr:radical SAM family heme chaperone HemW [Beggiatoa leptomitoformis]ALG68174.1 oxygen-independent coproporphyrinogen III oxidase-like protein [Beggiatoa leptomitoformis]AUI69523.1 oxygen-independent coproporphyrinogen III oxidase-like protein [Beggiatoa leptomitoformis]
MFHFTTLPPLSLYIHIPYCVRKCPYCDFNSHEVKESVPEQAYIDALIADLEQDLPKVWGRAVSSIFFGGGTPSIFSPDAIDRLLMAIRSRIRVLPQAEITLEANPSTVDIGRFQGFYQAGINRLSLGVQSFSDVALQALGRIHDKNTALQAIEAIRQAGFVNFNIDLMFGLPQQTVEQALLDLKTAMAYQPTHLSWYQLTLEPNTLFYRHPPILPDDDACWDIQIAGQLLLAEQGYPQYEVSAYARQNKQCQHNINYWLYGDYLGIGAGAHAKISDASTGEIKRYSKQRHPKTYIETAQTPAVLASEETLVATAVSFEFMLNALRLNSGFSTDLFALHTGLPITSVTEALTEGYQRGWLIKEGEQIKTTTIGQQFLNEVLSLFMA